MVDTKALLKEIQQELQPVNEQVLRHPYMQALEEGKIGREKLRLFAAEQYAIIGSDLKSAAHLVSRFGSSPSRSEEHTSELQSHSDLVCRLLLEKKKRR